MGDFGRLEITKWPTDVYEYYIPPHGDELFPGVTNVSKDEESNTNKLEHKVCSMLMVDSYMKSKD